MRSINHPAYRKRLGERLGFIPRHFKPKGIVIHAASVGEVLALKPFIEQCLVDFAQYSITVTTFTPTGSAQVQKLFGDKVQHCYIPLDIWPCSYLFLRRLQPKALVMMETELWPNLIDQATRAQTKLLLVNGRISNKSLPRYQKLSALISPCLKQFDQVLAQSEDNAERLVKLGASPTSCSSAGNLKYDLTLGRDIKSKQKHLAELLPNNRPIWLLASSHSGDEELILSSYQTIKSKLPNCLLIIVPRHPERFDNVAKIISQHQFSCQRRSTNEKVSEETQVWLMDSLGELMAVLGLTDVVTMGGTFSNIGGHNPLEPALFKKPVIVGNDMSNFTEVYQQLKSIGGIVTLPKYSDSNSLKQALAEKVTTLIQNPESAQTLGENAYKVVLQNQGATQRCINVLTQLLNR
ncbi:3-deoxy-D-manno-octulosonic acid transferase [Thalassotalea algicola]|uniref:3-deoxy-D-manno-octulosonic acid transferase n=1 Tax=Thalassotalea algicola TaxID=2716224 RepID=UPI001F23948B|nr:3-deoxy-D-manno-octulosonic acid transferase [Thalassotalea algicola]